MNFNFIEPVHRQVPWSAQGSRHQKIRGGADRKHLNSFSFFWEKSMYYRVFAMFGFHLFMLSVGAAADE